jgi:predicted amidophosphoribosyltransferase
MFLTKLKTRLYPICDRVLKHLNTECPLCGLAARGGELCLPCAKELVCTLDTYAQCSCCADYLLHHDQAAQRDGLPTLCYKCMISRPAFACTIAAMRYDFPASGLLHAFKEQGQLHLAPVFSRALYARLCSTAGMLALSENLPRGATIQCVQLVVILPVPASENSIRRRGFNPAGEIASALARQAGLPNRWRWLRRTRHQAAQKRLDRSSRLAATQSLYECSQAIPPLWIGVVDDVMTTGSTMQAVAQTLIAGGAQGVVALPVMRRFGGFSTPPSQEAG